MTQSDFRPGAEFDGYRILGVLGQGGMGIVYKAEDIALSRTVALKVIDPKLTRDELFVRRFRSEARALARIRSTHIVGVHALRQTDRHVFIVMEYVDGGTLKDIMVPSGVPWQDALPILRQMLVAFDDAHSVGVIHRDIKPSNIMLTRAGQVKVTDFGLAKLADPDHEATVTKGVAGTLYYMSPEQAKASPTLDHRSDLYSLGMTVYEMLAGSLPFDRRSSEYAIMKAIVEGAPTPLTQKNPRVPEGLAQIVMKALEKDPERRYPDARAMLKALDAFAAGSATATAAPAPADDQTLVAPPFRRTATDQNETTPKPTPTTRRLGPILAASTAGLLALVAAVWFFWLRPGPDPEPPPVGAASLFVTSTPAGATVWVGGDSVGTTPTTVPDLTPGPLDVRLTLAGHRDARSRQVLAAGRTDTMALALETAAPQRASLSIESTPGGATVVVDGEPRGTTPVTVSDLAPGSVDVRLERDGYRSWRRSLDLTAGPNEPLRASLTPVEDDDDPPPAPSPATIAVQVEPARLAGEVTVTIAGSARADGSASVPSQEAHRVTCSHPTYGPVSTTVTPTPGASEALTCYFEGRLTLSGAMSGGDDAAISVTITDDTGDVVVQTASPMYVIPRTLPPGTYQIRAYRDDLPGIVIEDPERTITIAPAFGAQPTFRETFTVRVDGP